MDAFVSFLIFAVLFYLMMRFGCGAHMIHGHGAGHGRGGGGGQSNADESVDPVCGKKVPPHEGYGKMHSGSLYRFCSRRCLDDFEADPERYAREREEAAS